MVENTPTEGFTPINCGSGKRVDQGFCPGAIQIRRQLKNDATTVAVGVAPGVATQGRRAVKIPCGVRDYAGIGAISIGSARETVNPTIAPSTSRSRRELEDSATAHFPKTALRNATYIGRAVEIAGWVKSQCR